MIKLINPIFDRYKTPGKMSSRLFFIEMVIRLAFRAAL